MPSIALPVSLRGQLLSGSRFNPISLFATGSQGIWLEPSDLTTMFQDRAGTTPVTTPGQAVGKRLDKSGRGNHAVAPTDAARPTYGVEPKTGRRNLLTRTEEFGDAVWGKSNATVSQVSGPEWTLTEGATTSRKYIQFFGAGVTSRLTVEAKPNGRNFISIGSTNGSGFWSVHQFNISSGVSVNGYEAGGQPYPANPSIVSLADGWYRVSVTITSFTTSVIMVTNGGDPIFEGYTGNGTSGIRIRKPQLELGSTATAYQRVGTDFDVTEAGVATVHYVQYDGSDDSMSTAAIDFTATDKMSVFAGVRKITNGNNSCIVELSAVASSNSGAFCILTGRSTFGPAPAYAALSTGTTGDFVNTADLYDAPISNLLSLLGDISGDTAKLRVNGTQIAQSTSNQGTGNYGNYPLFFGRRNNASLPFNGRDYGIIVVGKAASGTEITDTETWLAARTSGVTL